MSDRAVALTEPDKPDAATTRRRLWTALATAVGMLLLGLIIHGE